jgi:hypothetical protein
MGISGIRAEGMALSYCAAPGGESPKYKASVHDIDLYQSFSENFSQYDLEEAARPPKLFIEA